MVEKVKGIPEIAKKAPYSLTQGLSNTSQIPMYISLSVSSLNKVDFIPGLHLKYATLSFLISCEREKKKKINE